MAAKRKSGMQTKEILSPLEADAEDDHYSSENKIARNGVATDEEEEGGAMWPYQKGTTPIHRELTSPVQETGSVHDETSSSGNKEDEDEDEDEVDDLKSSSLHDPERLKAFNMFVRLFVDENLDRIVPISKQPKEKIQAIIDSCTRQFPEFAERARKRIRTYLKSCRRNKKMREPNSWPPETPRPTPAHLTSVQAEQILAQACENESHNAKRMRLGLEPVSQPMPLLPGAEAPARPIPLEHFSPANLGAESKPNPTHLHLNNNKLESPNFAKITEHKTTAVSTMSATAAPVNGTPCAASSTAPTPLYRPNFSQTFTRTAQAGGTQTVFPATPLFPTQPFTVNNVMPNGPTDLSMKPTKPLLSHKLNATEMAAVRQLITGYRESAAFLLRSADELEQLLLQQP